MAAPPSVTTKSMNGKFRMNKPLSTNGSIEDILQFQGISWLARRAIAMFSHTLSLKHSTNEAGVENICFVHAMSGGIVGSCGQEILDWQERSKDDDILGAVDGRSCRIPLDSKELMDEYLTNLKDWTEDTTKNGLIVTSHWSVPERNPYTWTAVQAWGFEIINGERRYVRHIVFTSPEKLEPIHQRLVYDYIGPV